MGMEIQANSLEEMCDLMCDNKLPKPKKSKEKYWIFTFGSGQQYAGRYVKVKGTFSSAREKMVERFGTNWGFQYSEKEWEKMKNDPNRSWDMETELGVIE